MSLVARAAALAASIEWLDDVVISTDDPEIASEAERHGARSPFPRPAELSGDDAKIVDAWRYTWERLEQEAGRRYDLSILLEPTSPLRQRDDIERSIRMLVETGADAVTTVSPIPAHFSPHKTLVVDDTGRLDYYLEDGARYSNRQTIPSYHHRNGACYVVSRENLVERGQLLEGHVRAVILDRPMANVDYEIDLKFAAFLLKEQVDPTPA
jgi:CMP-N-acetylneuraminic acid synthetase